MEKYSKDRKVLLGQPGWFQGEYQPSNEEQEHINRRKNALGLETNLRPPTANLFTGINKRDQSLHASKDNKTRTLLPGSKEIPSWLKNSPRLDSSFSASESLQVPSGKNHRVPTPLWLKKGEDAALSTSSPNILNPNKSGHFNRSGNKSRGKSRDDNDPGMKRKPLWLLEQNEELPPPKPHIAFSSSSHPGSIHSESKTNPNLEKSKSTTNQPFWLSNRSENDIEIVHV